MKIEPLDDWHDRDGFESGVDPLDRYLHLQAGQNVRRHVASCFVLIDEGPTPLAYYTLAATLVLLADVPTTMSKRLPRYPMIPATVLGRLAVDHRHRGRRLGEHMLLDALARTLRSDIATFAIIVDAKDETAAAFYRAYDFRLLTTSVRRLFLPMAEVARLFA